MQHVHSLVLAIPSYSIPDASAVYCSTPSSLLCPLCLSVLEQPVQLPCGALVCATCLCKWLGVSGGRSCPCCYQHDLDEHNITLPSPVVNDLLRDQRLRCQECGHTTTAGQFSEHRGSLCQGHFERTSPSRLSVRDILDRPTTAPSLPVERQMAAHLVRRFLSSERVVTIPTRGQVRTQQCILNSTLHVHSTPAHQFDARTVHSSDSRRGQSKNSYSARITYPGRTGCGGRQCGRRDTGTTEDREGEATGRGRTTH